MFYVYLHCRPDGTPFYVGKGRGRRAYNMQYRRNPHHLSIIAKHGAENIIVQIFYVDSEAEAFALECRKIAELRAAGVTLANQTDGGEGPSGRTVSEKTLAALRARKGSKASAETRARVSAAGKGRIKSPEEREKLRQALIGRKRPLHVIAALVAANTGRKLSAEHKAALQPSLAKAREAAKAWHASDAGLAWHSENGKAAWAARQSVEKVCEHCGAAFNTPWAGKTRFCSNNCRTAARRASGVDNVEMVCVTCGGGFVANKHDKPRNCSKTCADVMQSRTKRRLPNA